MATNSGRRLSAAAWTPVGEAACPCCGAGYRVEALALTERRDGYARCEVCDTLLDEWIAFEARRYIAVEPAQPRPVAASGQIGAAAPGR